MNRKRMTNVELVKDMMEFSEFGAMAQLFIMDAIGKMAKRVAEAPFAEVKKAMDQQGLVSPEAWHGVAKEIHQRMKDSGRGA